MALPASWTVVPVRGKYNGSDGTVPVGNVVFRPVPTRFIDSTDHSILVNHSQTATLDSSGEFTINLAATDDPDIDPFEFTWEADEQFPGGVKWYFEVPVANEVSGIDLADVALADATAGTIVRGSTGPTGATGATGAAGRGITNIARTSGTGAEGTTDTYTITYSDATTSTFDVYNGNDGTNGTNGADGLGISDFARVSGTGAPGTDDTYRITYTDATFDEFIVHNGVDGTGTVSSVNGQSPDGSGEVTLTSAHIGAVPNDATGLELIRDTIAAFLAQGANITVTHNDGANTLTIAATGLAEAVRGGQESVAALSGTTGAVTGDLAAASVFTITPTGNFSVEFTNEPSAGKSCLVTLIISQGATARTFTPPSGTTWMQTAPVQASNKKCVVNLLTVDNGATWLAWGTVQP